MAALDAARRSRARAAAGARPTGRGRSASAARATRRPVSDCSICCAWLSARSCSPSCACVETRPFSTSWSFESTGVSDSRSGWTMASSALWRPSRSVVAALLELAERSACELEEGFVVALEGVGGQGREGLAQAGVRCLEQADLLGGRRLGRPRAARRPARTPGARRAALPAAAPAARRAGRARP